MTFGFLNKIQHVKQKKKKKKWRDAKQTEPRLAPSTTWKLDLTIVLLWAGIQTMQPINWSSYCFRLLPVTNLTLLGPNLAKLRSPLSASGPQYCTGRVNI